MCSVCTWVKSNFLSVSFAFSPEKQNEGPIQRLIGTFREMCQLKVG